MDGKIVRIAEIEVNPEQVDVYRALLAEEIEASAEGKPGVLMLHAVAGRECPERIRILEVYADREAYAAHLQTSHFLKYKAAPIRRSPVPCGAAHPPVSASPSSRPAWAS